MRNIERKRPKIRAEKTPQIYEQMKTWMVSGAGRK
jgi:hypothetical protein